jgi:Uma2 family endonuclease
MAIRSAAPLRDEIDGRSRYHGARMSPEEYLALPEVKPYLEYIGGRVVQKMSPKRRHGALAAALSASLHRYGRQTGGAVGIETRVYFRPAGRSEWRLPDIAYWAPGAPIGDDDEFAVVPTLAVEIRSPGQSMASQRARCRFYRANGVDVCWLVDPRARTVERFEDSVDGEVVPVEGTLTSPHLPDFALPVAELFAGLDR